MSNSNLTILHKTQSDPGDDKHPVTAAAGASYRTCIVVLGMHRSGTSALTRVLSILGASLPRHVMGPAVGNETGHWEPEKLVQFHDELLAELASTWDDWTALDVSRLSVQRRREVKTRIVEIINEEYNGAPLLVVKDPRVCRFAPLFLEGLTDVGITPECVLVFRNPLEVAQSLAQRDSMPWAQAGLLWLRHVLDAEAATRGHRRTVLFYDDFLTDWRSEIRRVTLGAEPGHEWGWLNSSENASAQIDGYLNAAYRHHAFSDVEIVNDPVMSGWIREIHDALHQLRRCPAPAEALLATFDRIRREFDRAAPIMTRLQRDLLARLSDAKCAAADEAKAREQLQDKLNQSQAEQKQLQGELDAAHTAGDRSAEQFRAASARISELEVERTHLRDQLDDVLGSTLWRIANPARKLASIIPLGLRRQGRRVAKLAYWVLTPHRIGERITFLRARSKVLRPDPATTPPTSPPALLPARRGSGELDGWMLEQEEPRKIGRHRWYPGPSAGPSHPDPACETPHPSTPTISIPNPVNASSGAPPRSGA